MMPIGGERRKAPSSSDPREHGSEVSPRARDEDERNAYHGNAFKKLATPAGVVVILKAYP